MVWRVRYSPIMSRIAGFVIALTATVSLVAAAPVAESYRVTCRVPGDAAARVFVLEPAGQSWHLAFTSAETRGTTVRLALPRAQPEITASAARLSYRNANGGRQVDLGVEGGASRLDVWVDHGLEVNIEPDLDPRVDLMSTHGPLDGVQCTIAPLR
jgi:hypothetical protein